jgi:hypothetical protein
LRRGWPFADILVTSHMDDEIIYAEEQIMVEGKDELAMEQLDTASGGAKARPVEVDITPVTKTPSPGGPVAIPYPNTASSEPKAR